MERTLKILIVLSFLALIGMIFYFSSQPSDVSYGQSGRAVKIIRTINNIFDITDTELYAKAESVIKNIWFINRYKTAEAVVRKSAHFGLYFLLGVTCCGFVYLYWKRMLPAFLLGTSLPVMIAVLDEFNQGFAGRSSSLNDVIIDGTGALAGTLAVVFLIIIVKILRFFAGAGSK